MMKRADEQLPKGHPYCTDKSSCSFEVVVLQINLTYIKYVHIIHIYSQVFISIQCYFQRTQILFTFSENKQKKLYKIFESMYPPLNNEIVFQK